MGKCRPASGIFSISMSTLPPMNRNRKRAPTIVDVARLAGVAIGTVSRHINGFTVRRANRDQIERAIAELGFRRNASAVAVKTATTHIVGFLVPSLSEFHAALLEQLTRKMRLRRRAVLTYFHDLQPASMAEGLEFFASHRVDALVVDGEDAIRDHLIPYIDDGLAVVLYDNDVAGLPVDRVFSDNRPASRRIVNHLIDLGHRRIGTLHGALTDSAARERLDGYYDALAAHGIAPDPSLVVPGAWRERTAYERAADLMRRPEPPTAIFSANYNMTIGLLTWLNENGVRIPDDVSLVSFDDVPALRVHNPGITTVAQPLEQMAETISEIIDERLNAPEQPGLQQVRLDCDIILRGSTRRLPPPDSGP